MFRKIIKNIKSWFKYRKKMKLAKKFGAVRYMDTSSLYPDMKRAINIPLNDCIYADTDSFKKGE